MLSRIFTALVCSLLLSNAAIFVPQANAADHQPPNIVFIISDDQAWNDYGFMGHDTIETPKLDNLASESALFRRGYVPDSLCRPSLATMITGLYPHQHKISGNDPLSNKKGPGWTRKDPAYLKLRERLTANLDSCPQLPRLLAPKGYLSHQSGKWWEGHYSHGGFTHGMTHGDPLRGGRHGDVGLTIGRQGMKPVFDFIDQAGDKPYFLWYAPFLPHTPHNPPERLLKKYKDKVDSIHVAKYYAMCEWFDETCGQLVDYIDNKGQAENTLFIYVTDNGWIQQKNSGKYAPRSKRSQYDGGLRTPIMLRWKGTIEPGDYKDTLVSSIDMVPTALAAAGVEIPERLPGINLLDVAKNDGKTDRDIVFGSIFDHDVADIDRPAASIHYRWCVNGDWKLIIPADKSETVELFNIVADPYEKNDVSAKHPNVVNELTEKINNWYAAK